MTRRETVTRLACLAGLIILAVLVGFASHEFETPDLSTVQLPTLGVGA